MAAHLGSHQEPMRRWHRYSQSGAVPLTVNGVFFFFEQNVNRKLLHTLWGGVRETGAPSPLVRGVSTLQSIGNIRKGLKTRLL